MLLLRLLLRQVTIPKTKLWSPENRSLYVAELTIGSAGTYGSLPQVPGCEFMK